MRSALLLLLPFAAGAFATGVLLPRLHSWLWGTPDGCNNPSSCKFGAGVALSVAAAEAFLFRNGPDTAFWLGIAAVDLWRLWKHHDDDDQRRRRRQAAERLRARLRAFLPSPIPMPAAG